MTKDEVINYLRDKELSLAKANAAFIFCDLVFGAYIDSKIVHGEIFSPIFCNFSGKDRGYFYQIIAQDIISNIGKKIYIDYLDNPKSIDNKINEHLKLEEEINCVWEKYLKIRGKIAPKELLAIYQELVAVSIRWWYYGAIGEDKGAVILAEIIPKFAKRHNLGLQEADELFNTLSHPEEQTILNIERESFLNICKDKAEGKDIKASIEQYIQNYFWSKTDFYSAVEMTENFLSSEIEKEIAKKGLEGIKKEIENIRNNHAKLHDEKRRLALTIELTEEDRLDIAFAEKIILWVDRRKLGMMKDFYYFLIIMNDSMAQFDLNYADLVMYTVDEFEKLLKSGKRADSKELSKRNEGMFIVWESDNKRKIYYGSDSSDLLKLCLDHKYQGDIKGQVASRGGNLKFTGIVRVVHQPGRDIFNEGEILVTSMTRVEFVPLMRKAKAIITDEGGIACHAAIVSRELHLPCIIGTKIGTKALKDGDLVEIDMEKGIVKILKQNA